MKRNITFVSIIFKDIFFLQIFIQAPTPFRLLSGSYVPAFAFIYTPEL